MLVIQKVSNFLQEIKFDKMFENICRYNLPQQFTKLDAVVFTIL